MEINSAITLIYLQAQWVHICNFCFALVAPVFKKMLSFSSGSLKPKKSPENILDQNIYLKHRMYNIHVFNYMNWGVQINQNMFPIYLYYFLNGRQTWGWIIEIAWLVGGLIIRIILYNHDQALMKKLSCINVFRFTCSMILSSCAQVAMSKSE